MIGKRIDQPKNKWAHNNPPGSKKPLVVADETWSEGGGVLVQTTAPLTITNVGNEKPNNASGGIYSLAMLWPSALKDGTQQAVSKAVIDLKGRTIYQGAAEAALRGKCDDCTVSNGTIVAHLQANGNQVKPIVEIRHGKKWTFNNFTFQDGWPEIGEQKTAQPGGGSKLETSQQVGTVTFNQCTFTRWENAKSKSVVSRKPGVQKIVFNACIGPDKKKFSKVM